MNNEQLYDRYTRGDVLESRSARLRGLDMTSEARAARRQAGMRRKAAMGAVRAEIYERRLAHALTD